MKKAKVTKEFLAELEKLPNITIACKTVGISRQTYYRWLQNPTFEVKVNVAMKEGVQYINDMTEAQLFKLVQEKNWQAVRYWLSHRHDKYRPWPVRIKQANDSEMMSLEDQKTMDDMLDRWVRVKVDVDEEKV